MDDNGEQVRCPHCNKVWLKIVRYGAGGGGSTGHVCDATSSAQPGQEQRMDDNGEQCAGPCLRKPSHLEPQQLAARPTADLGDDGEDARHLGILRACGSPTSVWAADRIELYRGALEEAEAYLTAGANWTDAELENPIMARACGMGCREGLRKLQERLSRSGG